MQTPAPFDMTQAISEGISTITADVLGFVPIIAAGAIAIAAAFMALRWGLKAFRKIG